MNTRVVSLHEVLPVDVQRAIVHSDPTEWRTYVLTHGDDWSLDIRSAIVAEITLFDAYPPGERGLRGRQMLRECLALGFNPLEPFNSITIACLNDDEETARLIIGFLDTGRLTAEQWAYLYETPFRNLCSLSPESLVGMPLTLLRVLPPRTPDQARMVCDAVASALQRGFVRTKPGVQVPFGDVDARRFSKPYFDAILDSEDAKMRRAFWDQNLVSRDIIRTRCFDDHEWARRISERSWSRRRRVALWARVRARSQRHFCPE